MSTAKVSTVGAATLAALANGAVGFVGSAIYNIGADDHHTKIVLVTIEQPRGQAPRESATD